MYLYSGLVEFGGWKGGVKGDGGAYCDYWSDSSDH